MFMKKLLLLPILSLYVHPIHDFNSF